MEERRLNLNVPLLSVRRISAKPESPDEIKIKKMILQNPDPRKIDSCPNFDHLTRPASVPFIWEQIPGRPKADQVKAISGHRNADFNSDSLDALSADSTVSDSSEIDFFRSENSKKRSVDLQFQEYMMSRFLPAAKAVALEQQNLNLKTERPKLNRERVFAVRTQPLKPFYHDVDEDDEEDNVSVTRKLFTDCIRKHDRKRLGFLPRICTENSVCVLNSVSVLPDAARRSFISSETPDFGKPGKSRHWIPNSVRKPKPRLEVGFSRLCRTNQSVKEPSLSSRDLSPSRSASNFGNPRFGTPRESNLCKDNELKRFRKGISRSQELYPRGMKTLNVDMVSIANAANRVNSRLGTPSGFENAIQKDRSLENSLVHQVGEFLPRKGNARSRGRKRLDPVEIAVDKHVTREEIAFRGSKTPTPLPPPLPKTPTESWLWRTLPSMRPRNSISLDSRLSL